MICKVTAVDGHAVGGGAGGMVLPDGVANGGGGTLVWSIPCSRGRIDSTWSATQTLGTLATNTDLSKVTVYGGAGDSGTKVVIPVAVSRIPSQVSSVSDGP